MTARDNDPSLFDGATGELRRLLEDKNWSCTPLGPPTSWSPVLRLMVPTMLRSGFPTVINWGPEMVALYNEAYAPLLGSKHPGAVGQSPKDTWPEAWEWVSPRLFAVLHDGQTIRYEDERQVLERNGYPEECYFSFAQSPIVDVDGGTGGILTVATESTRQVLSDRRMRVVRELGAVSVTDVAGESGADAIADTCRAVVRVLETARESIPFAVAFLAAPAVGMDSTHRARQVAAYGLAMAATPDASPTAWAVAADRVISSGDPEMLSGLRGLSDDVVLPGPVGPLLPDTAMLIPLTVSGRADAVGAIMLGLSPYRPLDQDYQGFLSLIGRQLRVLLTDAAARESERHRLLVLADLDRAKTEFYQNVSHELRTPLTMLLAPLQDLLAAQGENPADRADLEAAVRAAERLRVMVDALLDFSGGQGGVVLPDRRAVDLAVSTSEAAGMFRSTAQRAGLSFALRLPSEPLTAAVDRSMWSTIVTNLVSNAVKYSSAGGGVEVILESDGSNAVLTVADAGIGIDPDQQARVFERFYRAEPGNPGSGAGIGLALVGDLVRLHDGRVELASEPGHGTTITVTVPLRGGETQSVATARRPQVEDESGPRVLVVEDDPDLRAYLTRLLLADGWSVDAAPDAEAALPLAQAQHPPAVVITDIMLPGRSGLHLLGELRNDPRTARIPVLLITGRGGPDAAGEGLAAGADDYITKPFSSRELLARVRANHELHVLRESAVETAEARADQLRQGLQTNRTIGTAIGILMGRHRLTAEQAFRLLTTASQNHNSKLRVIAAAVTETGGLPYRPTDVDDLLLRVTAR